MNLLVWKGKLKLANGRYIDSIQMKKDLFAIIEGPTMHPASCLRNPHELIVCGNMHQASNICLSCWEVVALGDQSLTLNS